MLCNACWRPWWWLWLKEEFLITLNPRSCVVTCVLALLQLCQELVIIEDEDYFKWLRILCSLMKVQHWGFGVLVMVVISYLFVGVYSAVPPPVRAQTPTAAPAAKKTKDSDSSDSSDEEEEKKVAGKKWCFSPKCPLEEFLLACLTVYCFSHS